LNKEKIKGNYLFEYKVADWASFSNELKDVYAKYAITNIPDSLSETESDWFGSIASTIIPLVLIGFKPVDIVVMYSITQIYGILVHTQMIQTMPRWFEWIFVSPSHHRVHHASNVIYLDKNMGMCLIIWDKLFGTFQEEIPEEPVRYGLTKPLENAHHPVHIVFHEWNEIASDLRKKVSFKEKLKYLFMPPGWSHDGRTKTAKEMRAEISSQHSQ
jgi:hypothetical protein